MEIPGRIENGMVILEGRPLLPEGAKVTVIYSENVQNPARSPHHIQVPLVRTNRPPTLDLTNAQIAEILDEEDAAS